MFDQMAYINAIDVKVESLFLIKKANQPFKDHQLQIESLRKDIQKSMEYEKGRGDNVNAETVVLWNTLMDENGGLLGEFLKTWEEEEVRNPVRIELKTKQIEEAFDVILSLENKRRREGKPENSK